MILVVDDGDGVVVIDGMVVAVAVAGWRLLLVSSSPVAVAVDAAVVDASTTDADAADAADFFLAMNLFHMPP